MRLVSNQNKLPTHLDSLFNNSSYYTMPLCIVYYEYRSLLGNPQVTCGPINILVFTKKVQIQ